jgi:hypothetical protein
MARAGYVICFWGDLALQSMCIYLYGQSHCCKRTPWLKPKYGRICWRPWQCRRVRWRDTAPPGMRASSLISKGNAVCATKPGVWRGCSAATAVYWERDVSGAQ